MSEIALPRKILGQFRTISKIINIYNVFNCNFLVVNVCDYEAASQHDLTSGKLGISSNTGHGRPPRIGNARPPRPDSALATPESGKAYLGSIQQKISIVRFVESLRPQSTSWRQSRT